MLLKDKEMPVLFDETKDKQIVNKVQKACFYGALQMPSKSRFLNIEFDICNDTLPANAYELARYFRAKEHGIFNILLMANHIQSGASLYNDGEPTDE